MVERPLIWYVRSGTGSKDSLELDTTVPAVIYEDCKPAYIVLAAPACPYATIMMLLR